jgi:hypothetical protein
MMRGNNITFTVTLLAKPLYIATIAMLVESPAEIPFVPTGAEKV